MRMVDWLLQVIRVLKITSEFTFFRAVVIMDQFFLKKYEELEIIVKDELHIIGLTSLFIASKYEDVDPIAMKQVLISAGHNKFDQQEILKYEIEMLKTLQFKLLYQTAYEEAMMIFIKL